MEPFELSLFGGFFLTIGGEPVHRTISSKGRALIAYLFLASDRPQNRSTLAALLWPGQPESAALGDLRQTLHKLSSMLIGNPAEHPCFLITRQDIQINLECKCQVDVFQFDKLLAACQKHHLPDTLMCAACLQNVENAVDLYRGNLLEGVSLPGCPDFQWWLTCRQEEYYGKLIAALKWLISHHELEGDYSQAIQFTQKVLEHEPWNELWHRRMITLLVESDQRIAAIRQYEVCRQILQKEFGIEPAIETKALYEKICNRGTSAE